MGQNRPFNMFQGIRYAEPPINERRFQDPHFVEYDNLMNKVDARDQGDVCPQLDMLNMKNGLTFKGQEDCLFLNVYAPGYSLNKEANRPVMVWVHGGMFTFGSGGMEEYGPERFMEEGKVVLVTLNYRLGVLGFLSTGNKDISGWLVGAATIKYRQELNCSITSDICIHVLKQLKISNNNNNNNNKSDNSLTTCLTFVKSQSLASL